MLKMNLIALRVVALTLLKIDNLRPDGVRCVMLHNVWFVVHLLIAGEKRKKRKRVVCKCAGAVKSCKLQVASSRRRQRLFQRLTGETSAK